MGGVAILIALAGCSPDGSPTPPAGEAAVLGPPGAPTSPRVELAHGFVDEATCAGCHATEAAAWRGSDHDLAMQPLVPLEGLPDEPIGRALAPWRGERVPGAEPAARAEREAGRPVLRVAAADGAPHATPALFLFGHRPLQQVLVPGVRGRLQAFTSAWDDRPAARGGQRWYSIPAASSTGAEAGTERAPEPAPGDPLHFTGVYQTWNTQCAECHSTDLRRGYDPAGDRFDTRFARPDVGCQACHGPGAEHVARARRAARSGGRERGGEDAPGLGLVVRFFHGAETRPDRFDGSQHRAAGAAYEVDECARCHARRHAVSPEDERGRPLLDDFEVETLRPGLYLADGQIDQEVYVYGSFLQSRMYARGVRCTDCHDPHSGRPVASGNALCTRCHSEQANPRFPGLPKRRYDAPSHHHHDPAGAGAACVGCHMPARTYMGIDVRRDHRLAIPRPDLTKSIGVPNACNACHADRSADWAEAKLDGWLGARRARRPHFGERFAAALRDSREADRLLDLITDPERPEIVRASAIDRLPPVPAPSPARRAALLAATRDASGWIRARAAHALRTWPPEAARAAVVPLLHDPLRGVRSEAAQVVVGRLESKLAPADHAAFERALAEEIETQRALSATPAANANLALLAERRGRTEAAEARYRRAIELDRGFLPAWANLAQLLARTRGAEAAADLLRSAVAALPDAGELHYSLALALSEQGRVREAIPSFERAARLLPERARVAYNWGLALQQAGRGAEARTALELADQCDPTDPDIVYALLVLHARSDAPERALPYARRLVELTRGAKGPRRLLAELQARVAAGDRRSAAPMPPRDQVPPNPLAPPGS